jgi:NAD(P)-dependent dehydrogenase (short-subunit alcohol dehydrogenase family)
MEISMSGRTAIVTGGSKGIGYAIATRFVASGADVLICARGKDALDEAVKSIGEAAKADKTKGSNTVGRIAACAGDVAKPEDVKRIYDEAMKAFGKVDILVNNAGVSRAGAFETLTDERMQEDLDQKLFAAIRMTRLVWPQMKERRWGRVINVLNIGAKSPRGNSAPTSVTRAAGMALTKVLANEGAPHNVLVNALLVGIIEADQHVQKAKALGIPIDQHMANVTKVTPLGRPGKASEFANMACFLASDAGSYITGTATNVDGGTSPVV